MRDSLLYLCPWCSYTGVFVDAEDDNRVEVITEGEEEPRITADQEALVDG